MRRILVTGAGGTASQNFIASLRASGDPCHVVGTDTQPYHLECADVQARYLLPHCRDAAYLDRLNEIVAAEHVELVHPQPDPEVAVLARAAGRLAARTFLPPAEVVDICHDKARTQQVLQAAGVTVPASHLVTTVEAVPDLVASLRRLGDRVWIRAVRGAGSRAALPIATARHALDWMHYWIELKGLAATDFMLCELLPGREYAFQSLWHEGRLVSSMARERVEYLMGNLMPSGQSSSPSIARTVHHAGVNETATAAIRAVDPRPHGVYCVDLKENAAGAPAVTEINIGRFFTTSWFFSRAGCNMPAMYVRLALGDDAGETAPYDPLPAGLWWVRGVDREPRLFTDADFTARRLT